MNVKRSTSRKEAQEKDQATGQNIAEEKNSANRSSNRKC